MSTIRPIKTLEKYDEPVTEISKKLGDILADMQAGMDDLNRKMAWLKEYDKHPSIVNEPPNNPYKNGG